MKWFFGIKVNPLTNRTREGGKFKTAGWNPLNRQGFVSQKNSKNFKNDYM